MPKTALTIDDYNTLHYPYAICRELNDLGSLVIMLSLVAGKPHFALSVFTRCKSSFCTVGAVIFKHNVCDLYPVITVATCTVS